MSIKDFSFIENFRPKVLSEILKENVVGQDKAVEKFSLAIYNHYKTLHLKTLYLNNFQKNNIFLLGPTGSGKTLLINTLKEKYELPVFVTSATEYTSEGYIGKSVTDIIEDFYNQVGNVSLIENSIIFIDEIDKIAFKNNSNIDITGKELQNAFLKLIEGTDIIFKQKRENITIRTDNILFICAGAFDGIDNIVKNRNKNNSIGFVSDKVIKIDYNIKIEDIATYGFKKEFLGRFNSVIELKKHNKETLLDILKYSYNSPIIELDIRFKEENCDFKISHYALEEIVNLALENETGARSLNKIINDLFNDCLSECINNFKEDKFLNVKKEDIKNKKIKVGYYDL